MARPKVPDDQRRRTAQACDSCKRRKQKCNGRHPCDTCTKRSLTCDYANNPPENGPRESTESPRKRRHIESPSSSHCQASPLEEPTSSHLPPQPVNQVAGPQSTPQNSCTVTPPEESKASVQHVPQPSKSEVVGSLRSWVPPLPFADREHRQAPCDDELENHSRKSAVSGPDEEATVFPSTRMLQDSTGRLLYLGDSATLSYLQLIRMIVEDTVGPSAFTGDPSRHRIMENTVSLPHNVRPAHRLLPDRQTSAVLVDSFFTNTMGLIEVFDRNNFQTLLESCYTDPLDVDPSFLCLLYLVFAIGLVLAVPSPDTPEYLVIKQLRNGRLNWAEMFYRSAKALGDPVSGFEDDDFWSVQALLLMSVYMLSISKRNAANAYFGMAVRSAVALGLHREEASTPDIFGQENSIVRRNLWRTLFVLDRFHSASLGRPTAISEGDCSSGALKAPQLPRPPLKDEEDEDTDLDVIHSRGIDAAVRSSQVIGVILEKVYSKRKISTGLAQEIANMCKDWPQRLHPSLHWSQAATGATRPAHGIAILHTNLLHCHSMILLTRPFLLYMITKRQRARSLAKQSLPRIVSKMEKFSEACVIASYHTIFLVQKAFMDNYLPQRNPFVHYFLFAASLIVLTNEFGALYHNDAYETCISNAISITQYCAETDPQAARCLYILAAFRDVVARKGKPPIDVAPTIQSTPSSTYDPMADFLGPHDHRQSGSSMSPSDSRRQGSDPKVPGLLSSQHPSHAFMPAPTIPSLPEMAVTTSSGSVTLGPKSDSGIPPDGLTSPPHPVDYYPPPQHHPQHPVPALTVPTVSFSTHTPASEGSGSGSGPGSMGSGEGEFDFDVLWNRPLTEVEAQASGILQSSQIVPPLTPAPAPAPLSAADLPHFVHGGDGNGANGGGNIPLYPSTNFL